MQENTLDGIAGRIAAILIQGEMSYNINTFGVDQNGRRFAGDIFEGIFLNAKFWISNQINIWCNIRYFSIGLDNGVAPNRQHVMTWANVDPVRRRIYASPSLSKLKE